MDGIIITSTWNPSTFHPHNRRINQWIEALRRNKIKPNLFSLSGNTSAPQLNNYHEDLNLILGEHPIIKNGVHVKKRNLFDLNTIVQRIKDLLWSHDELLKNAQVVIVCHPMLAECANGLVCKKVLDFPDAPKLERDIINWGFHSKRDFFSCLSNYELTFLHKEELTFFEENYFQPKKINIVPPVTSTIIPPTINTKPKDICIHGRNSLQSYKIFLKLFNTLNEDNFCKKNKLKIIVCGELSNLISERIKVDALGPIENLQDQLHDSICPIVSKEPPSGISMRVLDVVESGGLLIASTNSLTGYPAHDYPYKFETVNSLPTIIDSLINNFNQATQEVKRLQGLFTSMTSEAHKTMDNLLKLS